MSIRVNCKNENDVSIDFTSTATAEYFLEELDGAYTVSNNISSSDNTMTDGSVYQGSTTKTKNIVVKGFIDRNYVKARNNLYVVFKPKSVGTLKYYEDDEIREIEYRVESINIDNTGVVRHFSISLICTDPFFKDLSDITVEMAGWQAMFSFPHQFLDSKEEFGKRIKSSIKTIGNDSAADYIGIKAVMTVDGTVINPALYHVEQGIFIKVGTNTNPFEMHVGDSLVFTTGTNNKNIYLIRNGVSTNVNEYLDENSDFIQLVHGKNSLKYDADQGQSNINLSVSYRLRYLGV